MSKKHEDASASNPVAPGEDAEKAEASGVDTIQVEWNGRQWTVPADYGKVPAVAFRGLRNMSTAADGVTIDDIAEAVDVLEDLLGRSQFSMWRRGGRSKVADAYELVNTIVAAWGTSAGE